MVVGNQFDILSGGIVNLDGGILSAESINVGDGGAFSFSDGILEAGTFDGDLTNAGGVLAPGGFFGVTDVNGFYFHQSKATLEIEIGGPLLTADLLDVSELVFLEGELKLVLVDEFLPQQQQSFTIVNTSEFEQQLFGEFHNVADNQRLSVTNGSGSFLVRYGVGSPNPSEVVISDFQQTILGDVNGDGVVNLQDVAPFVSAILDGIFVPAADVNQNGTVDLLDVAPFIDLLNGN